MQTYLRNQIAWPQAFPAEEYAERRAKVRKALEEAGLDAIYVTTPANITWLTGYDMIWYHLENLTGVLLRADTGEALFFDSVAHTTIVSTTPEIAEVVWLDGAAVSGAVDEAIRVIVDEVGRRGLGRIRMRQIPDASADSLQGFVREAITPGSLIHTDGWVGYHRLEPSGYGHRITVVKGQRESAADLLPRVHQVVSLLKRWLLGTHHGAVSFDHLDYYLDEFTFRFNRRTSRSRGKLFYRLAQQAVAVEPVPYKNLIVPDHNM